MKNKITWGDLTPDQKLILLSQANCIDGRTGCNIQTDGECIVDLTDVLSVTGMIIDGEIIMDNNAVIYSPTGDEVIL